jgi:hypothetical protein
MRGESPLDRYAGNKKKADQNGRPYKVLGEDA